MQSRWLKNLSEKEVEELKLQLIAAKNVLKRLSFLIQGDLSLSVKKQESKDGYESPSWAYCQADSIGEIRAYKKVLRLIDLEEK